MGKSRRRRGWGPVCQEDPTKRSKGPLSDLAGRAQPPSGSSILVERAALAVVREPTVEIVVPVHNEERDLERSVRRLRAYLDACFPFHAVVTIADNASTDGTQEIGEQLALLSLAFGT